MITSSSFLPIYLNFRKSLGLYYCAYLLFRHGCTTVNFNWILIRQRWFSSLLNTTRKACLSFLCWSKWNLDSSYFNCLLLRCHPRPESLFSAAWSPAPVKSAILNCIESVLSIATCHKMLSRRWSLLLSCPESICNSLYTGCPEWLIHKLQKVQNNAARLICQTPKSDHISPILHQLPVEQRILNKNCFSLPLNL